MIEAVIFDMDGLMIDTEAVNYIAFGSFFKHLGVELSKYDYCVCFTGIPVDIAFQKVKDLLNLDYEIEDAKAYLDDHQELFRSDHIPLKPGLYELLDYLKSKQIKIGMATSSGLQRVYKLFEDYEVLKYYDEITCGTEVKRGKPAPDIFLKACEKLNVHPENALVLEDSEAGIEAAYNAHIPVICIPDLKEPDNRHSDMLAAKLPSLHDVIKYVEGSE